VSEALAVAPKPNAIAAGDLGAVAVCGLIWGTTWFAITQQFGVVAPTVSVVYRFALASALIFAWRLTTSPACLRLTPSQHLTAFGQGLFVFALNYGLVYAAETHIVSAVVAVAYAGLAFVNTVLFRFVFGERAPRTAWAAAALGLAGVGILSGGELVRLHMDAAALRGVGLAIAGMLAAAIGNLFSHRAHANGADIVASTAWSMGWGSALLALFALATGESWSFDWSLRYVGSLAYLAVLGSVVTFLVYFALARRRGYTFASYISAVTPLIAMSVSTLFEHARWGASALAGVALVIFGQVLLIRTKRG
jgi:drug/metabolite transporter (DMT)-like permease